jgi:hypothetical protein
MPAAERRRETGTNGGSSAAVLDNWPDTRCSWARKGADAGLVNLWSG